MAEIKKTYTVEEKTIAVDLYNRDGLPFNDIASELNIPRTNIKHWVRLFERESLEGLEEKRGKAKGLNKGRNEIIAYHISKRNDPDLVLETLQKATSKQRAKKTLLHSDQGFQYSFKYTSIIMNAFKRN